MSATTLSPSYSFKPHIIDRNSNSRTSFFGKPTSVSPRSWVLRPQRRHVLKVVSEKVVRIDLGTTNSAVAAMEGGQPTINFDEVERMVAEAERYAKEDKEKRDAIDTKNQAESAVYQCEKQLKELGEKVPNEVKEKVEAKLKELKDAISGGSTQTIKDAMAALNQEAMQLGQALYSQMGGGGGAATGGGAGEDGKASGSGGDGDGEVINANFIYIVMSRLLLICYCCYNLIFCQISILPIVPGIMTYVAGKH